MFTPMDFENIFVDFLKKEVAEKFELKGFDKKDKKEIYKNPEVFRGFLLPKISGDFDVSKLPYIVFRIERLETRKVNNKNIHCLKTIIVFGCYCSGVCNRDNKQIIVDDGSGYRDLWNIMEHTRQILFNGTYVPKVQIFEDNFSMEVSQEQYYPVWEGQINVDFLINIPEWEFKSALYKLPKR